MPLSAFHSYGWSEAWRRSASNTAAACLLSPWKCACVCFVSLFFSFFRPPEEKQFWFMIHRKGDFILLPFCLILTLLFSYSFHEYFKHCGNLFIMALRWASWWRWMWRLVHQWAGVWLVWQWDSVRLYSFISGFGDIFMIPLWRAQTLAWPGCDRPLPKGVLFEWGKRGGKGRLRHKVSCWRLDVLILTFLCTVVCSALKRSDMKSHGNLTWPDLPFQCAECLKKPQGFHHCSVDNKCIAI